MKTYFLKYYGKTIVCFGVCLCFFTSSAQSLKWAKNVGGGSADQATSIAVDAFGNVLTTGVFGGTADFDPNAGVFNLASAGGTDIFISKLDAAGNFIWAKRIGGVSSDEGKSISTDTAGNVYVTGYFQSTVDFDPNAGTFNMSSGGLTDVFLLKLDPNGNFIWAKKIGGTSSDEAKSLTIDALSNIYITGFFGGSNIDFDPGVGIYNLTSAGGNDIFVLKLNSSGNFVWARAMGGTTNYDYSYAIKTDKQGNVYTTGSFQGTADFDPGVGIYNLTPAGDDIFISKLDLLGNFVWAKQFGGPSTDIAYAIDTDTSSNVYIAGLFQGTADFDPSGAIFNLVSAGSNDPFICKIDSTGNFVWAKHMGSGLGSNVVFSIYVDKYNNVYSTGSFTGTADFDPGSGVFNLISAGGTDIFISKLDVSGNFICAKRMGASSFSDFGTSISADGKGTIYTTGYFQGTANFDPNSGVFNLTSFGNTDVFIHKMEQYIFGNVTYSGSPLFYGGSVVLYNYYSFFTSFDTVAISNLDIMGNYYFDSVKYGDYIIKVFPNSSFPTLIPSYFGNTYLWDSATVLTYGCNTIDTANIIMTEQSFAGGPGTIGGRIIEGPGFSRLEGDPIPGIDVKLGRNPGGQLVTNTTTNGTGYYSFGSIALNDAGANGVSYTVYADIPGLDRVSTYTVTIDATTPVMDSLNYIVDSISVYINPILTGVSNIDLAKENKFTVYPNPFRDDVTVTYSLYGNAEVKLDVYNLLGIKEQSIVNTKQLPGDYKFILDNNLNSGVYFISLTIDGKRSSQRIVKTK